MFATTKWLIAFSVCITLASGCQSDKRAKDLFERMPETNCDVLDSFRGPSLVVEEPVGIQPDLNQYDMAPLDDFNFSQPGNYHLMSLEECIYAALQSSPVIRELGGVILRSPEQVATIQDPAVVYTDPRFGEEAALSAFDARLNGQFIFQKNDRVFNNRFLGDNGFLKQSLATYRVGVSKLSATGGLFEFNQVVDYDLNNSPSNRFNNGGPRSHSYDEFFEAGFRQPLLQGAGVEFNRIAGPNNAPGVYNGVLIARANTDITIADFEVRLRNLISNVENAYWDLYFAYRDLETRIEAREGAYKILRNAEANQDKGAAVFAQAKEQYFRFASDVENAIYGRLNDGTQTNNGSSGGTFRRNGGVRTSERRLRLIAGMPLNASQLIVPADRPTEAAVVFDWYQSKSDALLHRPELRRQRWQLKRRQLELLASCNNLLPRVDLLGKYRLRGFGENLFGGMGFSDTGLAPPDDVDVLNGSSAAASLLDGDLQEWELGIDVNVPVGFRKQHAAYRNAELLVAREKAILKEQERQVIYGLSNALGELNRSVRVRNADLQRVEAAKEQFEAVDAVFQVEDSTIFQVLEAQRRVIEAKLQYYQSEVDNMLALRSVHFEKGTLFDYHNIIMSETGWVDEAQRQAIQRDQLKSKEINYYFPGLQTAQQVSTSASQLFVGNTHTMEFAKNAMPSNNSSQNLEMNRLPVNGLSQQSNNWNVSNDQMNAALATHPETGPAVSPQAFHPIPIIQTNTSNLPASHYAEVDHSQSVDASHADHQASSSGVPMSIGTGARDMDQFDSNALPMIHQPSIPSSNQSPQSFATSPNLPTQSFARTSDTLGDSNLERESSSKVADLATAISRVTEKAQKLGTNMVNFAALNEEIGPALAEGDGVSNEIPLNDNASLPSVSSRR